MSAPFSGPSAELGRGMERGMQTYFQHLNDQGGISGRKVRLIPLDDGYEPERAVANMKELQSERGVCAVVGSVGTPTAAATVPYALENKMLIFGPYTGAPLLRKTPPDRYVFNFRASYAEETDATVRYLIEVKHIRPEQIAVFAQQDGYGDAGFQGVAKVLRKHGRAPEHILRVGYVRNTTDVKAAALEVQRHPEIKAVVMVPTYRPAARFIQLLRDANFDGIFTSVSFVDSDALIEELRSLGPGYSEGVIITEVVPPISSQSSAVLKYREHLRKYYPNERPSFISLEGYLVAEVFAEGLRRAGPNINAETMVNALESIHGLEIGLGAPITFGPSEHQGSHTVWAIELDRDLQMKPLNLD